MGDMREPDLIVCRCEDVTLAQLSAAVDGEELNVTQVKHRTRAGMGPCGGRTCRPLLERLLGGPFHAVPFTQRLPVRPVTAGQIARTPLPEDAPATECPTNPET